jgi:hypothetical protein
VKTFPDDDSFRKAVESLVSVIHMQFKENHKSLEAALMVWRAMLILLHLEQFYDWSWKHLFDTSLEHIAEVFKVFKNENIFSDFLRLTVSKQ